MNIYKNNSNTNLEDKEKKFNSFLNKTIIMSSRRFYKREVNLNKKEQSILYDEDFSSFLELFISDKNSCFDTIENKIQLNDALSNLSVIEQAVIFLLFEEDLSQDEAAKILEICSKSVSRIKLRAINKMKKFLIGDDENEE